MKSTSPKLLIGLLAVFLAHRQASANIILSLEPASQTIGVGSPVSMDLVVSGLNAQAAPGVGAFDFDLTYNPAILSAVSVAFGSHLDLGVFGSIQSFNLSTPGTIHLDEVSLEASWELELSQPSSFKLASLGFSGTGPGLSSVDFAAATLSDAAGQQSITPGTVSGQVEVTGASSSVPDATSTASLLPLGLLGLLALRRAFTL